MEIVYKTSRILAYILAVIAVLGILDVIFNIEWSSTFENFTEWEKYDEHFNSNSTLVTLQPIVNILYYVRPILYVGMFLFFLLLKIKNRSGNPTLRRFFDTIFLFREERYLLLCLILLH